MGSSALLLWEALSAFLAQLLGEGICRDSLLTRCTWSYHMRLHSQSGTPGPVWWSRNAWAFAVSVSLPVREYYCLISKADFVTYKWILENSECVSKTGSKPFVDRFSPARQAASARWMIPCISLSENVHGRVKFVGSCHTRIQHPVFHAFWRNDGIYKLALR